MEPQKKCPRCGAIASLHAPNCVICGHVYRTRFDAAGRPITVEVTPLPVQPTAKPEPAWRAPASPVPDNRIRRVKGQHSVGMAVMLSLLCINSGGQVYNGQYGKAIFYFLCTTTLFGIALVVTLSTGNQLEAAQGLSLVMLPLHTLLWFCSALDAGLIAARLNNGEAVTPWQWM